MENLLTYIYSLTGFSEESWKTLQPVLTKVSFKKGDYLLKEDEVCNSLFFIEKGYCRSYYDKDGIQKNTAFYFEDEIATNIVSFGSGQKSTFYIQACEDLRAIVFDKHKLFETCKLAPQIELLGKKCLRLTTAKMEEHANLFVLYDPQERYEYIEQKYPNVLQRVSLTYLSSYLGMARETLSRIRKRRLQ